MRILGIDPGTSRMGWGVIKTSGDGISADGYGVIDLSKGESFQDKIRIIHSGVSGIIEKYNPRAVAIEEPFFAKNPKVLLRLGQTGGAVMSAVITAGMESKTYSVLEVKQAVTGYGNADKKQVQEMVKILLGMDALPAPADAADALAAAICHHNMVR